jgi:hypothetical protein
MAVIDCSGGECIAEGFDVKDVHHGHHLMPLPGREDHVRLSSRLTATLRSREGLALNEFKISETAFGVASSSGCSPLARAATRKRE